MTTTPRTLTDAIDAAVRPMTARDALAFFQELVDELDIRMVALRDDLSHEEDDAEPEMAPR